MSNSFTTDTNVTITDRLVFLLPSRLTFLNFLFSCPLPHAVHLVFLFAFVPIIVIAEFRLARLSRDSQIGGGSPQWVEHSKVKQLFIFY